MNYEVLMLKRACEALALKNLLLSARVDELEQSLDHVRLMVNQTCEAVAKGGEADADTLCPHCDAHP